MKRYPLTRRELLAAAGAVTLAILVGFSLSAKPPPAYRNAVLADKPIAWWRLGESKGPTAHDELKHHPGTYKGKPLFHQPGAIAGDTNTAVGLDGKSSYIEVKSDPHFSVPAIKGDPNKHGLTVEVWLRYDKLIFPGLQKGKGGPYIHWLGKGNPGEQEWGLRFYSKDASGGKGPPRHNRISAYIFNPSGGEGAGAYFQDVLEKPGKEWIHVVATYDDPKTPNAGVRIYKNGVLRKGPPDKGTLYSTFKVVPKAGKAPLRLGTMDLGSFLTGGLDEVAIYPRVLSAKEIMKHYQAGR
jgi:hypothetical protein